MHHQLIPGSSAYLRIDYKFQIFLQTAITQAGPEGNINPPLGFQPAGPANFKLSRPHIHMKLYHTYVECLEIEKVSN